MILWAWKLIAEVDVMCFRFRVLFATPAGPCEGLAL